MSHIAKVFRKAKHFGMFSPIQTRAERIET
ncbi:hypothetical protein TP2_06055 [Thioclava pacifica DSM 10166]|uniref:Uncharacterized protein n=1 Tax=Thioclava pacifica DSM 10166 TaxID=1353537 RepID=A0A074JD84_9RHOB|nr:hypothetical protein TP2_06055 [Thioclava pacifica DSM 10166]